MIHNLWLQASLLLGLVITVAIAASLPVYSNTILQRMLTKELQRVQIEQQTYPGGLALNADLGRVSLAKQAQQALAEADTHQLRSIAAIGPPVLVEVRERLTVSLNWEPVDQSRVSSDIARFGELVGRSGLAEHIRLVDGRLPAGEPVQGTYEVLVRNELLASMSLVLGTELQVKQAGAGLDIRIKPVGVFEINDIGDGYWAESKANRQSAFYLDYELFQSAVVPDGRIQLAAGLWYYAIDYMKLKLSDVDAFVETVERLNDYVAGQFPGTLRNTYTTPAMLLLADYPAQERKLMTVLWSIHAPLIVLLAMYLYMSANQLVANQKNEIAVLRSRGASRLHVWSMYLIESVLMGGIAIAVGPLLAVLLVKILGASNGFLSFVNRASVEPALRAEAYVYAIAAAVLSICMTMIPVIRATRASIVNHKQQLARQQRPSWVRYSAADVLLLLLSVYLFRMFNNRMDDMKQLQLITDDLTVDPLMFVAPSAFMLGASLLLLRLYPYFVRAVYWLGRKTWPPALYAILLQVGRTALQYRFIMLFLALTLGIGMFSISAARTINQNTEDKIRYAGGADVTMQVWWHGDKPAATAEQADGEGGGSSDKKVRYIEPSFAAYTELPGVESAARVYIQDNAAVDGMMDKVRLMGIQTDEFGRTAWLPDGLLAHHFYDYLNLIAEDPRAVLISRPLADKKGLKPGDIVRTGWQGTELVQFRVFGIVDYWPGMDHQNRPMMVIGHLATIQNRMGLEPYDIWLKLAAGATSSSLYESIGDRAIPVQSLADTRMELTRAKNDPFLLAINGGLTLGFLISLSILLVGFFLYWIVLISGRVLHMGILRAMGVSVRQIVAMLGSEQALTSGAALAIGLTVGYAGSKLFVPFFQLAFDPAVQVPPFNVQARGLDLLLVLLVVLGLILTTMALMAVRLVRLKIHQAVKLGED